MVTTATMRSATTARVTTSLKSGTVFTAWAVIWGAYMALPIPPLVRLEVREWLRTAVRHRSHITMMGIVAVIHVAIETMRPVVPRPRPNEQAADKPIRPIIAIRSAVIRGIFKVPIGTNRRHANIDGNLGRCSRNAAHQRNSES